MNVGYVSGCSQDHAVPQGARKGVVPSIRGERSRSSFSCNYTGYTVLKHGNSCRTGHPHQVARKQTFDSPKQTFLERELRQRAFRIVANHVTVMLLNHRDAGAG